LKNVKKRLLLLFVCLQPVFLQRLEAGQETITKVSRISKQCLHDFVLKKVPDSRKSTRYNQFLDLINRYADEHGEITLLHNVQSLFRDKMGEFSPDTIIYRMLEVTANFLTKKLALTAVDRDLPDANFVCSICFENPKKATNLECCRDSIFCLNCLASWYALRISEVGAQARCPICRVIIMPVVRKKIRKSKRHRKERKLFYRKKKEQDSIQQYEDYLYALEIDAQLNSEQEYLGYELTDNDYLVSGEESEEEGYDLRNASTSSGSDVIEQEDY